MVIPALRPHPFRFSLLILLVAAGLGAQQLARGQDASILQAADAPAGAISRADLRRQSG